MRYYAQTMPGVEEIAWLEIRSRLANPVFLGYLFAKEKNGIVVFEYNGASSDLLELRTTEDVFLQALSIPKVSRDWRDLRVIAAGIRDAPEFGQAADEFLRHMKPKGQITYRVISRRHGKHQYRRKDIAQAVHKGIKERFPRWRPVADDARLEIWANVLGSHLLVGLRLSDRSMRHRYKKAVELEASLRPSVAAALVYLTQLEPEDRFIDPMCGSGTLLLERQYSGPYGRILGGDVSAERTRASWQNLASQRKDIDRKAISVSQWDGRALPLAAGSVNKAATNLPFGKQIGSRQDLAGLYAGLFAELERVLVSDGQAVILSSEYDLVKETIRQRPGLRIDTGYSIAVLGQWGRAYILRRRG